MFFFIYFQNSPSSHWAEIGVVPHPLDHRAWPPGPEGHPISASPITWALVFTGEVRCLRPISESTYHLIGEKKGSPEEVTDRCWPGGEQRLNLGCTTSSRCCGRRQGSAADTLATDNGIQVLVHCAVIDYTVCLYCARCWEDNHEQDRSLGHTSRQENQDDFK